MCMHTYMRTVKNFVNFYHVHKLNLFFWNSEVVSNKKSDNCYYYYYYMFLDSDETVILPVCPMWAQSARYCG